MATILQTYSVANTAVGSSRVKASTFKVLILALVAFPFASLAHADTYTDTNGDIQISATVSSLSGVETVTLDIQCTNVSVCGSWYLGDVTLKGFTFTGNPTLGPSPSGYTIKSGGEDNKAVGAGGGCNGSQGGMAICWDAPSTLGTQLGGGTVVFTGSFTGSGAPDHIQLTGYDNTSGIQKKGGKVLAISDNLTDNPSPTPTPEPASLVLLGSGLLTIGGFLRRKLQ